MIPPTLKIHKGRELLHFPYLAVEDFDGFSSVTHIPVLSTTHLMWLTFKSYVFLYFSLKGNQTNNELHT